MSHSPTTLARLAMVSIALVIAPLEVSAQLLPDAVDPGVIPRRLEHPTEPRQPPPMVPELAPRAVPPGAEDIRFVLENIRVDGVTVYGDDELASLWAPLIGRDIALAELFTLADRITARYRGDGYILSRALVPAQEITGGMVRLRAVEGHIEHVIVEGDLGPLALVHAITDRIAASRPLHSDVLERNLLLIDDLPGVTVESVLRPSPDRPGAAELVLIGRERRLEGELGFDNRGTRFAGPLELSGEIRLASALGRHDRTRLRGVISPAEPDEMRVLTLEHTQPLGSDGTRIGLFGALVRTRPGSRLEPFDVRGRAVSASLALTHPLVLTRRRRLDLGVELGMLNSTTELLGAAVVDDRIRALRLGGSWERADRFAGITLADVELSQGLDVLGARGAGSALPSRAAGRSDFTKLALELGRLQRLADGWSLFTTAKGQYAASPLLVSETFDFGGESYGRGYDPSELTGDHGLAARIELRWGRLLGWPWLSSIQPFASYDLGVVWNIDHGAAPGLEARASAASASTGLRFDLARGVSGTIEVALPLTRPPTVDRSDGRKRPRPFFRINAVF